MSSDIFGNYRKIPKKAKENVENYKWEKVGSFDELKELYLSGIPSKILKKYDNYSASTYDNVLK